MKDISRLIFDIYRLLETTNLELKSHISHEIFEGEPNLRMSNLGMPLRKLYYELTRKPDKAIDGQSLFKFTYGHILEAMVMDLAEMAGHEVKDRQREVELDGVMGHIDGVIDQVLVDAKSCSPYAFEKFKTGRIKDDDSFGYLMQLSGYHSCLPEYKRAFFLPINKVTGEMCLYELTDENRKTIEEVRQKIKDTRSAVVSRNEPSRCYEDIAEGTSGNRKLSSNCGWCDHKYHCWRDSNNGQGLKTFDYSNGNKWLTHIVKQPRVDEIKPFQPTVD